jgi:uncharacterized protein
MSKNIITWFEIYVHDMDRARMFYKTVCGLTTEKMEVGDFNGEMYNFPYDIESNGISGALVKWDKQQPNAGGSIIYFNSEDCNIELANVEQAGGKIIVPKMPAGSDGFSALILDSEGNTIGFYSSK